MQILWAFALRSHACICPRNAKTHSDSAGEEKEFKTLNKDKKRYTVDSGDAEKSVLSHQILFLLTIINSTSPEQNEGSEHSSVCKFLIFWVVNVTHNSKWA